MTTVKPLFLIRFYLKEVVSYPVSHQSNGENYDDMEPCVFRVRPSVPLEKVANRNIWFYKKKDWNQKRCHGNNIVGVIVFFL